MCETASEQPRYIIDLSTPETLERDFYAWLKGEKEQQQPSLPCLGSPALTEASYASPTALPSISQLGEFIGYSSSALSSPNSSYSFYSHRYPEDGVASSEGDSPVPSSSASSTGSSLPSGSPMELMRVSMDAFPEGEKPAPIKMGSRFPHSVNGRSSGTNQLGRTYSPGLPLSMADREQIVGLYQNGWKICDISKKLCVTHSCVSKILNRFRTTGSVRPKDAKESRVESPLVAAIRDYRFRLGMTRQSEIREQLILDGICRRDNVPSRSSINHILRTKLDLKKPKKKDLSEEMSL